MVGYKVRFQGLYGRQCLSVPRKWWNCIRNEQCKPVWFVFFEEDVDAPLYCGVIEGHILIHDKIVLDLFQYQLNETVQMPRP